MTSTPKAAPSSDQAVSALQIKLAMTDPEIPEGTVVRLQYGKYTYVALWVNGLWYHTGSNLSGRFAIEPLSMREFLSSAKNANSIEVVDSWKPVVR